jgi:hypothetical protein
MVRIPFRHLAAAVTMLACVGWLADGSQTMLTPAEFEQRFGWKNDPTQGPHLPGMERYMSSLGWIGSLQSYQR